MNNTQCVHLSYNKGGVQQNRLMMKKYPVYTLTDWDFQKKKKKMLTNQLILQCIWKAFLTV